jgi:hypothetical protein
MYRIDRWSKSTLLVLLSLSIVFYFVATLSILFFPYAVDYGEAPIMDQVERILSGKTLYRNTLDDPPYVISNYPPLFLLIYAGFYKISGLPLIMAGRFISLVSTVISAILLAHLAKSLTSNWVSALFTGGVFLGHPYLFTWSGLARVDSLALMLCIAGISIVYHHWRTWLWTLVASFIFLSSIFTRQSYLLAGPLAAFIWLWTKDRSRSLFFLTLLVIECLGLLLLINTLSSGGFFFNIFQANLNQFDVSRIWSMGKNLLLIWPVIFFTILVMIVAHVKPSELKASTDPFISSGLLGFTIGSILSSLTVGKVGSDINYYLEFIAAGSLWCGIAVNHITTRLSVYRGIFYLAWIGQLIWLLAGGYIFYQSTIGLRWENSSWYEQLSHQIKNAAEQGQVLSDDYLGMVVQAGQSIYYQPFEIGQLYQAGLWNPSEMAEEIRAGRFPLIVIGGKSLDKPCCWPPELVKAIQERYLVNYQDRVIICVPSR